MKLKEIADSINKLPAELQQLDIDTLVKLANYFTTQRRAECQCCHATFIIEDHGDRKGRVDRRYCSDACRAMAHRNRHAKNGSIK